MLEFHSVSKYYPFQEKPAIDSVEFKIDKGELVFLTGPSGAGKTTLMKLMTRAILPDEGEIIFDGENISKLKGKHLFHHRRKIGVVFQDYKLLPELNAWENIALSLEISGKSGSEIEERVTDLLKLVDLTDKAFLFPSQLSGGEAQRASIARALATGPQLIFADEPTGNLDTQTASQIIKILEKINKLGTTIIIATHDQNILNKFKNKRKLTLENGKLIKNKKNNK